ncbi:MAG: RNA-binding protein [Candidatus Aquicultor secundus]|uniref:RNA-binding protein n=1 Tax=Candidatus Aquicultor secundus TaxID=1973895 RepID=A0A2M7T5N1_9ACTN|nr:RNA-binding protein [Candidatus Aquicultor secundus]NCO66118.1 RNA-binding protein [Solirubrobacter sp.]OIO84995.1 MAG: RNA-binding protein [Candidatus Aquicultor secundus]PIU28045.1 MAG: RNA-binding protein [Candidatus Aquicultor secundus]PIW23205.1 MAG: RNA-binding protein [Candidatus Aquicultor secundus]PIX51333.1 MAG: RNA-binding protein [Candidatus Aquicultor secundus]
MRLYVGNLSYTTDEATLQKLFSKHGDVESVNVIIDRDTGRSKGFGFIDMPNDKQAKEAILALNGSEIEGRTIKVSEAKPQERREGPRRAFGGGRR